MERFYKASVLELLEEFPELDGKKCSARPRNLLFSRKCGSG
ncbi:hypothetical protein [Desulfovirgula thermocuniculi]|nr:hypothetical protein [Desulfovirgula thermocuniculi]